jgi:hypothetical protein
MIKTQEPVTNNKQNLPGLPDWIFEYDLLRDTCETSLENVYQRLIDHAYPSTVSYDFHKEPAPSIDIITTNSTLSSKYPNDIGKMYCSFDKKVYEFLEVAMPYIAKRVFLKETIYTALVMPVDYIKRGIFLLLKFPFKNIGNFTLEEIRTGYRNPKYTFLISSGKSHLEPPTFYTKLQIGRNLSTKEKFIADRVKNKLSDPEIKRIYLEEKGFTGDI